MPLVAAYAIGGLGYLAAQYARSAGSSVTAVDSKLDLPRLPIFETVLRGITIKRSVVGSRLDLGETFELYTNGRTGRRLPAVGLPGAG